MDIKFPFYDKKTAAVFCLPENLKMDVMFSDNYILLTTLSVLFPPWCVSIWMLAARSIDTRQLLRW